MKHRQFGYMCLIALSAGTVAIASSNCSVPFSFCGDGTCTTTSESTGTGGTTSSTGGSGGVIATGGGGSGGIISTGGSGSGGTGGQGGGVTPVLCGPDQVQIPATGLVICWYLAADHHPPGTTMGLGGVIRQPGQPENLQNPFPGCVTSDPSANTLVCPFGDLAVGTDFVFDPYATDGASTFLRCDVTGLPGSKCFGEYRMFIDGVLVAYFIDPPTGRWSYDTSGGHLRLVYTDPT